MEKEQRIKAMKRFLERKGHEVLTEGYVCKAGKADFVTEDDGTIVFIDVAEGLASERPTSADRAEYERIAMSWLRENKPGTSAIRFDRIAYLLCGSECLFLRWHKDALSAE
jgi:putative endonuclease